VHQIYKQAKRRQVAVEFSRKQNAFVSASPHSTRANPSNEKAFLSIMLIELAPHYELRCYNIVINAERDSKHYITQRLHIHETELQRNSGSTSM
jgi:hypothetical protein